MEERKMILKMIEDGKITAEEGLKLLEALEDGKSSEQQTTAVSTNVNWSEGREERQQRHFSSSASKFTSFLESAFQKIKDFDLDFNFGTSIDIDHIFQHREISPKSLDISLENGSIEIIPWDEPDVRIECQAKVYRVKDSEEARRVFLQESRFNVDAEKLVFQTKVKYMKTHTVVYVPKTSFDLIKLYTFNGQIKGKPIVVDTLDVNTLNGGLSFDAVTAKKVMAETVNGSIELKQLDVHLIDAKTIHGGITLLGQMQDVDVETINGTVTYELTSLTKDGYADLKATTGSINITLPDALRVEGKLKTNVGGFLVDVPDHEVLSEKKEFAAKSLSFVARKEAQPTIKINATTNTGSISTK
ncbi:DUF4097 family beta strand repeat-containing protein [Halalkalibacter urbisdiaboli]|uniref:DUF4097 family beta strand repeat-containing protein n=1 Tax=Halalkalibacter urbisdiaboli TaxID=1960589 RepID=UPI000B44B0A0|nr:DUF4097 domain-containing protein [Halalkalibacter urbisdiaboli]